MSMSHEQNETGIKYLHELLAEVERAFPSFPSSDGSDEADDVMQFGFVLRTLLLVVGAPRHPREHISVEMAALLAPDLLAGLLEDEPDSFTGVVDLARPNNQAQQIAAILMHAIRIFAQCRREYREPPRIKIVPQGLGAETAHD